MAKSKLNTKPDRLNEKVLTGLAKIGQALRSVEQKRSFDERLSPTQAQVLVLMTQGASMPSEIARRLAVSRASLSDSLSSLVDKGLIRKRVDPQDSRFTILELTAKGKKRSLSIAKWPEDLMQSVNELTEFEKAGLLRTLSKFIIEMQERGLISVPAMCASCKFFRPNAHPGSAEPHHCDYVNASFADKDLRLDCNEYEISSVKHQL